MHLSEIFISDVPYCTTENEEVTNYSIVRCFSDEAVYVYSLEEKKIMYASGWEQLLGYKNEEISMQILMSITTPEYKDFIFEMNNRSLEFILQKTERVSEYSCTIESKKFRKDGSEVSLLESVRVFRTRGERVKEVLGTYKLNPRQPNPRFRYFHASGLGIENLIDKMRQFGPREKLLTNKQQEILWLISQGKLVKDIASQLFVSKSSVEKIIREMCKKFQVKGSKELIAYSHKNNLL